MTTQSTWAGDVVGTPTAIETPPTVAALQALVRHAAVEGHRVKAMGSGHSFTPIAGTTGTLLRLDRLTRVLDHDPATGRVRVEAGITIRELNARLAALGLALPNLGDIDAQTLAGAISTGTHGTGARSHGISHAVVGVQLVTATGDIVEVHERHPWFRAAQVSLGALGVITEVTLQCVPAFLLHAREEPWRLDAVLDRLDEFVDETDHCEFYWFPHTDRALLKRNNRVEPGTSPAPLGRVRHWLDDEFLSNTVYERVQRLATRRPALVPRINQLSGSLLSAREYTAASHDVFVSPRRVRFREAEFAVPREAARPVIAALRAWFDRRDELISFPIEVRFTAADDLWLSTASGRESAYIAVHQFHRLDPTPYVDVAQAIVAEHGGRPHWGKLHTLGADDFAALYPRFDEFRTVRDAADPDRRFTNPYLERVLGP